MDVNCLIYQSVNLNLLNQPNAEWSPGGPIWSRTIGQISMAKGDSCAPPEAYEAPPYTDFAKVLPFFTSRLPR